MEKRDRHTLLIVDDEPEVVKALERLFREEYRVLTAHSPEQAREVLARGEVQLLMSDHRMPGMTGVEFLTEVRARHPAVVRMLITGYSDLDAVIRAINEGHVYAYVSKPWDPQDLELTVRQAAEYWTLQEDRRRLLAELQGANAELASRNARLAAAYAELQDLDRMKTVFMELVSHELNTPIAIILGYSFLLEKELEEDEEPRSNSARALRGINTSAQRLRSITNRIFHVLSSSAPNAVLERSEVPVSEVLEEVRVLTAPFIDKRLQTLVIACDPPRLRAYIAPQQIVDALVNLVMNAIKFTPDTGVIGVSAFVDPANSDVVCVEVRDRGIGIDPEDQPHIFSSFFGTFNSRHHSSGEYEFRKRGLGLGLAMVRRYADLHEGEVVVESAPGEGSTFTLRLPRRAGVVVKAAEPARLNS